jgi:phosphoesterase RecJ-like protein
MSCSSKKSLSRIAIEKEVLNTVEYHFDNRSALVWITTEMMERTGVFDAELEGVAAISAQLRAWRPASRSGRRTTALKIPFAPVIRSTPPPSAAIWGGGGHRCAAGCFIEGSLDFAKKEILAAVGEALGVKE